MRLKPRRVTRPSRDPARSAAGRYQPVGSAPSAPTGAAEAATASEPNNRPRR